MTPTYKSFLSKTALGRKPSPIRKLYPMMSIPGMISFGGGLPNGSLFPIEGISVRLKDGSELKLEDGDMSDALQYTTSFGLPRLVNQLKALHTEFHEVSGDWEIMVSNGSQDALEKAFQMLLDPGDSILVEAPTYSGALAALQSLRANIIGVPTDKDGLQVDALRRTLQRWPAGRAKPKALYTIPTGQNPSGSTLSVERRREVVRLAAEYDFLLLEDDPYYHIQFLDEGETRPPSLQTLDDEGRVLRFDSFSKVVSSGLRLGYASGPKFLVDRLQLHQQASNLCVSGLSQAVLAQLLEHWGRDGFLAQRAAVEAEYRRRRDLFCGIARRELAGLAHFDVPRAGMFLWIHVPTVESTADLVEVEAVEQKVLLVPGDAFDPERGRGNYVRASFSTASDADMATGLSRLRAALSC